MLLYLPILLTDHLFGTSPHMRYTYAMKLCAKKAKNSVPTKMHGLPVEITYPFFSPSPCQQAHIFLLHTAVKRCIGHNNFVKESKLIQSGMVLVTRITLAIMWINIQVFWVVQLCRLIHSYWLSKYHGGFNYRFEQSFKFTMTIHPPENKVLCSTSIESSLNACEQLRFQNTVTWIPHKDEADISHAQRHIPPLYPWKKMTWHPLTESLGLNLESTFSFPIFFSVCADYAKVCCHFMTQI
jgi:hypothetical protein